MKFNMNSNHCLYAKKILEVNVFLQEKKFELLNKVLPNYEDKNLKLDEMPTKLLEDKNSYTLDLELRA